MRFAFFLREALRGLSRSSAPALAAMLTVVITAPVLGVFTPVVQATTGAANEVKSKLVVDVFLEEDLTSTERTTLRSELDETPHVRSVELVTKNEGLAELEEETGSAYENTRLLGRNPLPDVYRLTPDDSDNLGAIVDSLAPRGANGEREPQLAGVDDVQDHKNRDEINSFTNLVKLATGGLALLLILASIGLIANTIRLSIFARRREVEVMKLVGATNWFIRWPFMIEGVIVGVLGGIVAVLLLTIAKETFIDPLADRWALLGAPDTMDFPLLVALLLVACVAVSAVGSGLTLRRFLRV
jgi:cell division transport system permease protein